VIRSYATSTRNTLFCSQFNCCLLHDTFSSSDYNFICSEKGIKEPVIESGNNGMALQLANQLVQQRIFILVFNPPQDEG